MADRINVPLDLDGFETIKSEVVDGVLEVTVRSTRRPACHHCGSVDTIGHGVNERRIRDRACAYPTVLRWLQRRLRCPDCERTFRETHPAIPGRRSITCRYRRALFERARNEPFSQVAAAERVSIYRVLEAFDFCALEELAATAPVRPRVVSLDEHLFGRRQRFHTALCDPESEVVLGLVDGRDKHSALQGLGALGAHALAAVETVVMDMHSPYRQAVQELLPQARIVLDRFHVVRVVNRAAGIVRIRASRTPDHAMVGPRGGTGRRARLRYDPTSHRLRWVFMKRAGRLSESERADLETLFERRPEIGVAWLMKEAFAAVYDAGDRFEAERRLDLWVEHLDVAGLKVMKDTWRFSLGRWRDEILAYFDDPVTNGFAEGLNNKIKVIKRTAYGFRRSDRYRCKVILSCGRRRAWGG